MPRLSVLKTYKLAIDGKFPRSESGRTLVITDASGAVLAHASRASRKDLREAVEAARRAQPAWAGLTGATTAYLRGQILYRAAEMLEARRAEFVDLIAAAPAAVLRAKAAPARGASAKAGPRAAGAPQAAASSRRAAEEEVSLSIDRLVHYAGWADKYSQVLGCHNPVAGPHYNFTVPEPTGVVGVIAPDDLPLLALISLIAPPLCAGNTVVAFGSQSNPMVPAVLGEIFLTGDVPAGVVNILTGERAELLPHFSKHREIDAIHAAGLSQAEETLVREGIAENLKRVTIRTGDLRESAACESPWWIEPFVEMKTIWHPAGV
jgi:acyl-CoA reductase-like NAD-dependent aldehyde dehydrogenase